MINPACKLFHPLLDRIRSLPAFPDSGDRDALLILAVAVLRDRRIEADWTPEKPELVSYPVLLGLPRQQTTLEQLNAMDLLRREFSDRDHLCRSCKSRLRLYCVDYDKPEFVVDCLDCHHQGAESVVGFRCADCGGHTPVEVAETRDWSCLCSQSTKLLYPG